MTDLSCHELLTVSGGNAPDCYEFLDLSKWGLHFKIQWGNCMYTNVG
jgi:hypothetical protein